MLLLYQLTNKKKKKFKEYIYEKIRSVTYKYRNGLHACGV